MGRLVGLKVKLKNKINKTLINVVEIMIGTLGMYKSGCLENVLQLFLSSRWKWFHCYCISK